MAYSFSTSGATPFAPSAALTGFLSSLSPKTPAAKALSTVQLGATSAPKVSGTLASPAKPVQLGATSAPTFSNGTQTSATPFHATPTTPVKSQTDAAGNTTTYHAPVTPPATQPPAPESGYFTTPSGAVINPANGQLITPPAAQNTPPPQTPPPQDVASASYPGLLAAAGSAASGAVTQGSQAFDPAIMAAQKYQAQLSGLMNQEAQENANINASPLQIDFKQGQEAGLQSLFGAREQAAAQGLSSEEGIASTGAGLEGTGISGLNAATGNAAPGTAFTQVSPGNYLANSQGQGVAGGQATGIQAATNWAIAQQNMAQGRDYQGQAQALSNALQTLAPVQAAIVPYMSANNLDSNGIPFVNQQINKINQQANPAAYATMEAAISDARSYAIQILGSQSGANPTDVTNSVNSFDFNNFTPEQLNTFLNNLNVLGQYRLSQAQSAMNASYSANTTVGTPAAGQTATPGSPLQSGGANILNSLPDPVKAIAGGAVSITSDTLNALGASASSAVGSAAGTGLAGAVLGI